MSTDHPTALRAIIRLERERADLRAAATSGYPPLDIRDRLRTLDARLERAWEVRRLEMRKCTDAEPATLAQDRKGLMSIAHKADRVGRSLFVQMD